MLYSQKSVFSQYFDGSYYIHKLLWNMPKLSNKSHKKTLTQNLKQSLETIIGSCLIPSIE